VNLVSLGLSHATTPLALREHFAVPTATLNELLTARPGLDEYAVLSTCNRLEAYALLQEEVGDDALFTLLEQISGLKREAFDKYLYRYAGADAVRHLARVAAGLESLVVGESQILGQVADAAESARLRGITGPVLEAVFRSAVRAGKRARTETGIGRNAVSISSVAVRLAQDVLGELSNVRVLIIGAGEMAELAVEALRKRGVGRVTIINRTLKTAQALAARWGAQAQTFDRLEDALAGADLVIASSAAPSILVTPGLLRRAVGAGRETPLVFIDIALPRNVSPQVTDIPNIYYYDMDDLKTAQDEGRAGRERAIPQVEAIIAEELQAWQEEQRRRQIAPLIAGLHARAEAIRQAEIERTLQHWPGAGEAERRRLEALTESIVNRLLHHASTYLKTGAGEEQAAQYAAMLQELFVLEELT
jgi:glutamyl-tRNA reductase